MKELPYIEEIYDLETEQLDTLLQSIDQLLLAGANNQNDIELPKGFESFDKFERKALKVKEAVELELQERRQVDDVISFFVNQSGSMFGKDNDLLNDDKFYQPMQNPQTNITSNNNNNVQIKENNQIDSILQRHTQSTHLNQQNLNKLTQQSNTARDDKLETDTNYSQYMKQSTDDTQSQYTQQQENSDNISKRMFANRPVGTNQQNKNKKDLGAFMREKLAKTKIASESMGVIQQSIAINPNNFKQKKKQDNDDSKSVISSSNQTNNSTIYKPNLKKKPSIVSGITSTTKVSSNMVSGTVSNNNNNPARKASVQRVSTQSMARKKNKDSEDDNQSKTTQRKQSSNNIKAQTSKDKANTNNQSNNNNNNNSVQNSTATSNIYKPTGVSNSTNNKNNNKSKPPIPTNNNNTNSTKPPINTNNKDKQSNLTTSDKDNKQNNQIVLDNNANKQDKDQINQWEDNNNNNDNDQQLLGQEEIESQYDDTVSVHQQTQSIIITNDIHQYVNNSDDDEINSKDNDRNSDSNDNNNDNCDDNKRFKVADLLNQVEINNPQRQQQAKIQNNQNKNDNDQEEVKVQQKNDSHGDDNNILNDDQEDNGDEEDDDFYKPIDEEGNNNIIQNTNTFQSDQEKLKNIFDYENQDIITSQIQQQIPQIHNLDDKVKVNQLQIQTEPQSTTSKKIRGKVQIFVDESQLNSAIQTPKIQQIQEQTHVDLVQSQLKLLEDQDNQLNNNNTVQQKPVNKRMEQLKQLMNEKCDQQNMRKQEQDERLKLVRDQIQKDKEQKQKQDTNATTNNKITENQIENSQVQTQQNTNTNVEETKKSKSKATTQNNQNQIVKKKQQSNKKEGQISKIPRQPEGHDQYIDYSGHYKTFYDIFVGQLLDPKNFDMSFVIRDTRNTYAAFVNIMDDNAISMKKKFQFEQAPLEKSLQDYYKALPDFFTLAGKSINELELEMKNRGNQIMMQAMAQQQLKNNFQQMKSKDVNDIVKEAQEKAAAGAGQITQNSSNSNQLIEENRESTLFYRVVKNRTEVYDIISRAFSRKIRWNELPHGLDLRNTWNLMWTWSKIKIDITKLIVWQKCNHFSGAKNVSRKDFLKRNIERAQKMSSKANSVFNILPLTFILPKEYVGFLESFSEFEDKEGKLNYWIMKPAAKSRGRGISLVNDLTQITYGEPIVVQRYIKNPLLINGYKFDMRIYVLVTSVNPLEVFLYKEGFGRFSTMPFSLDPTDRGNKYIHLTNVSIQKYNVNNSEQDPTDLLYGGTKISIQTLKKRVQQAVNVNWDEQIWPQISDVVLKSMVACQNDIQFNPCCFELFGFDILIDSDLKCWLIEINSSPSLARETLLDDMIKQKLIDDIIDLVDPVDFDRKRLFEVLERRINEDFKQQTTSNAYSKKLMNRDLTYILNGHVPRRYGEMPKNMGGFERIAPSPHSDQYLKLIGGQKMFGSMMKMQGEQTQGKQ